MKVTCNKKYEIHCTIGGFVYALYALVIILNDWLSFITKKTYSITIACSFVIVVVISVLYLQKCKIKYIYYKMKVWDILCVGLIFILCTWRAIIPEASFDTSNYHLYFQEFLYRDYLNYDFFPIRAVNAQSFGAFGDRMYYCFRFFLGYRMGTLLNTLVIILIYFQLKLLLYYFWREMGHEAKSHWANFFLSIGVLVCLMTENTYNNLSTYMVDYLAGPFLLEIILIIIHSSEDKEPPGHTPVFLCLLAGFAVGVKLTNSFLLIPLALYYLVQKRKELSFRIIIICLVAVLFTNGIYLYIGYCMTGNPVFPYLNGIFQSPYFSVDASPNDYSGFNERFGPKTFLEFVLWPIYMWFFPERTGDVATYSGRMFLIWIFLLVVPFGVYRSVFGRNMRKAYWYLLYCYLLFLTVYKGYMRYSIILELLGSILLIVTIGQWIGYHKKVVWCVAGVVASQLFFVQVGIASYKYFELNYEWSWRDISDWKDIAMNLPYVFKDRGAGIDKEIIDNIDCFVVADASGSLAVNLKDNVPIIAINHCITNDYVAQLQAQRLEEIERSNIYSLSKREDFQNNLTYYQNYGLALDEVIPISPDFYDKGRCLPLLKLKSTDEKIRVQQFASSENEFIYPISDNVKSMEIFVGDVIDEAKYEDKSYQLSVIGKNSETGEAITLMDNVTISQRGQYEKCIVDFSAVNVDEIILQTGLRENGNNWQLVIQEYLFD